MKAGDGTHSSSVLISLNYTMVRGGEVFFENLGEMKIWMTNAFAFVKTS
jgi:hypothetical protein